MASSEGAENGSEFVVRLPTSPGDADTPRNPPVQELRPMHRSANKPERRRILVVDDNTDAANSLAKVLILIYGQDVRVAFDGAQAIAEADSFRPKLVLLDLGLPDISGYEVAEAIRRKDWSSNTVIVAVTGWDRANSQESTPSKAFDHHLVKPIEPEAIRRLLRDDTATPQSS